MECSEAKTLNDGTVITHIHQGRGAFDLFMTLRLFLFLSTFRYNFKVFFFLLLLQS